MKGLLKIFAIVLLIGLVSSCKKDTRPNYQFMPNMYEPVSYETYQSSDAFNNGMEAQLPVEGTIARGFTKFEIENTTEGYELAKATLTNPLDSTQVNLDRGKELFSIYCAICHGNKGNGEGYLGAGEGNRELIIPGSYADPNKGITTGSIYHVIYYGKNTMGSYANQLNEEERWQVVAYVEKLKAELAK